MSNLDNNEFDIKKLTESAEYIKQHSPFLPKLLIICGSGLGGIGDTLENAVSIKYETIPNFPRSTVEGHEGVLIFGRLSGVPLVCMKGRFHYYEGHSLQQISKPIRIMKLVGVKGLIISNAAGSVNPDYKPGDIMVIKDHVNFFAFAGQHPLRGSNDPFFGDRFFPMNQAYDKDLIEVARRVGVELGLSDTYQEGVYGIYGGPNFETVAEVKILKILEIDAIGMSTIPEVLVAKHCGMTVFGFSFITNRCVDSYDDEVEVRHDKVLDVVNSKFMIVNTFVRRIIEESKDKWL